MCVLNSVTVAGSFAIDTRPVQPVGTGPLYANNSTYVPECNGDI